ncbi:MAG: L-serine ammonia-lyase, iron-sulfur-dependent, subunit alpha [Catonella sp.]|uniref:L-serine ammonia-lyase, iron-sulfur-dependent, subunit alpha n=1 Tax=Catonella sp. TaxID=2382125 RepID=UPI003FA00683
MYDSLEEIVSVCEYENIAFPDLIIREDASDTGITEDEGIAKMHVMWKAMLEGARTYDPALKSRSGLVGGDGLKMQEYRVKGETICGDYMARVIQAAIETSESNACMKRIVAAPTAGSCGVLPAVLVPFYDEYKVSDDEMVRALFVAAGVGEVVAKRASISGAEGGCQAEMGTAAAMGAAALVYLKGGTPNQMIIAAGIAIKNMLGLVCDPVAGLVEVPCVKRNVIGAVNACSAADMALAGIVVRIPPDQIIDAMKDVGDSLNSRFKETARGGLAITPEGIKLKELIK